MHAGELDAELVWPHTRHPRLRLVAGNRVVVASVTGELTASENAAVFSRCVWQAGSRTPLSASLMQVGENARGFSVFKEKNFQKLWKKNF
jgi:hypothetical protein